MKTTAISSATAKANRESSLDNLLYSTSQYDDDDAEDIRK